MHSIYNSQDEHCKTPFGAVKVGERVCFALRVPTSYGCKTPYLLLQRDGQDATPHIFTKQETRDGADIFTLSIAAPAVGLYFYWFDLWVDYRKLYRGPGGQSLETTGKGEKYQLTVYSPTFATPQEIHGGVMYQIFPDRFCEGDPTKPLTYHERIYRPDKTKEPYFWPTEQEGGYLTQDYYGGDLLGIEQKLPYLQSLGVGWIYLNPIFEAHSNHRYNTADYLTVDPYLGTNQDFARLCKKAATVGMHIILDGVFSHTGDDSLYFNKHGRYSTQGAWQGKESPYYPWFLFKEDGSYESWWGFDTLPTCNKQNPEFRRFICGEGGVVDHWLQLGASGFRLDVADELPDNFIEEIRAAVKRNGPHNLLIGEVWEDATTKQAYGVRRRYFWGNELDGVMNYPFRTAILSFLHTYDASALREEVMRICENYPAPALAALTNHLSTHDTVRAITALAGEEVNGHDRYWQSGRRLTPQQYAVGIQKLKLAFVLQFTLPGVPCVYYGDEIGMQGYKDPFNRAFFDWNSHEEALKPLLQTLAALRKGCPAFKTGALHFETAENGLLVYRRAGGGAQAAVAVNVHGTPTETTLLGKPCVVPAMGYAWRAEGENLGDAAFACGG